MKEDDDMRVLFLVLTVVLMTPWMACAGLEADFSRKAGSLRQSLHCSGFGPLICSFSDQAREDIKAMGFLRARTHDWALINHGQRVCDWFDIFPLCDEDAENPKNYVFGPTDYLLKRTREEMGLDVFFRLGSSIEHSGKKVHFNTLIPSDFHKVADVFAGIVRHYNRGWANGFRWNVGYWEIWNEPDNWNNMWCLPNGDLAVQGTDSPEQKALDERRRNLFAEFFVCALKRLKSEFGDEIKVGGPAMCFCREDWFGPLLEACKAAKVAPDFLSWHDYGDDPANIARSAGKMRRLCAEYGFDKCELIVDEWHYFGSHYNWDAFLGTDPKALSRVYEGPDSHFGIRSACYNLVTLANLQESELDQAYYYGCRHTGVWGYKDSVDRKYKVFYSLKLFGDILRDYETYCPTVSEGTVRVFAVAKEAEAKKGLLVVDYGGAARNLDVRVSGLGPEVRAVCHLLDDQHNLEEFDVGFENGTLTLVKPDYHSAAFFVEFASK